MSPEQIVAFAIFAAVAAGTPGPSNALLTATGAQAGVLRGLPALLGVALGMGLLIFVVAYGLGSLIPSVAPVLTAVKWLGAAVLCWFAWQIATADVADDGSYPVRSIGLLQAAAFQWVNPKSWLVSASAAATFLDRGAGRVLGQSLALALIFVVVCLVCCFPWLAGGAVVQQYLRSRRARRLFNGIMGVLLAASVVLLVR